MRPEFYIGVDGGGTRCRARVRDAAGRRLGEGVAGPANPRRDAAAARREILRACTAALAEAGLPEEVLGRSAVGLGLAGVGQDEGREAVLALDFPFGYMVLDTDAYTACLGAHRGRDGAVMIVGTGTCGLALVGGRRLHVGGWGFEISDDGSGAWIGHHAVRRSLWTHDGLAPETGLTRAVMDRFGNDPAAVVAWAGTARPADHAAFAALVVEEAGKGDPLAVALMEEAAGHVACAIARLIELGAPAVALVGGLAGPLRPWLPREVLALSCEPRADAMDGAILMVARTLEKEEDRQ
jgi:glucosamine kinase